MSNCPCCGKRHVARRPAVVSGATAAELARRSSQSELWVDDALVACCRRAGDHAVLANRASVETADRVAAIAMSAAGREALSTRRLAVRDVAALAQSAAGEVISPNTRDGQRILRNGPPPAVERVRQWALLASQAELQRAA